MSEAFLESLSIIFSASGGMAISVGCIIGLVVGILPGLGQGVALMLTLPIVLIYPKTIALIIYAALLGATTFGGSITSVILGIPGSAQNLTTMIDGHPLARDGHAGSAIGLCAFSSLIGAFLGMIVVVACIPLIHRLIYLFGSREYFLTVMLAAVVVSLVADNFFKGFVAFCFGSMIAMIGCDRVYAVTRFTGGIFYFWGSIPISVFIIGLFALSGLVRLQSDGNTISSSGIVQATYKETFSSFIDVIKNWRITVSSAIIGIIVGIIPGVGGEVAQFVSYGFAKVSSKNTQRFGHGDKRGVIASEASNSAKDSGALLPTICLGIPGAPEMAILLGILMTVGITPGPGMLTEHENLLWLILLSAVFGNVISCLLCVLGSPLLSKITVIPINYVFACTIPLAFAATFSWNNNIWDCVMLFVFCLLGLLFIRSNYPISSLILGYVLGPLAERNFHTMMQSGLWNFQVVYQSIIAKVLIVAIIILSLVPIYKILNGKKKTNTHFGLTETSHPKTSVAYIESLILAIALLLSGIACAIHAPTYGMQKSGLIPFIISIGMAISSALVFIIDLIHMNTRIKSNRSVQFLETWRHYSLTLTFLLGYIVLMIFCGIYISTFFGMFIFFKFISQSNTRKAIISTLLITAFMALLFKLIFGLELWSGSMPMIIPGFLGGGTLRSFF